MQEKTEEILKAGLHTLVLLGSITAIAYIHDCKYGKIAQERWERDSIIERHYQDSVFEAKQDSIYRITGTYKRLGQ